MTLFYVSGPRGSRDQLRALLDIAAQFDSFGDECITAIDHHAPGVASCEELVLMPGWADDPIAKFDYEEAKDAGMLVWLAHREKHLWRLVVEEKEDDDELSYAIVENGVGNWAETFAKNITDGCIAAIDRVEHPGATWGGALNHEGLHVGASSAITVYSGKRVDPLNLDPDDLNIYDIAQSLSRQCRYGGHCDGFLSVARHSLWVAARLAPLGPEMELWGLLHDASEAYVGDMVKPLKRDPSMARFVEIEDAVQGTIARWAGLPPMPDEVHEADRFVTVEVEIGLGLRNWNGSTVDDDYEEFLQRYYWLEEELDRL